MYAENTGFEYHIDDLCTIKYPWMSRQRSYLSFAFTKNSSILPFFNHAIIQLRETGVLHQLLGKWQKSTNLNCDGNELTDFSAITLQKVTLLISLVGCGVFVSMIMILIEIVVFHFKSNK